MSEKRALNTMLIALAVCGVTLNVQTLLAAIRCEKISHEFSESGIGGIVPDLIPVIAVVLAFLVFAVAAGIFLAECYRRSFPAMPKWAAYLIAFGSIAVPIRVTFYAALGIPCFKSAKKSPKWLWAALMALVIVEPFAVRRVDNTVSSHLLFYDLAGLYLLMLLLPASLAAEKVGRRTRNTVIGLSALSVAVWIALVGYEFHLERKVEEMTAAFRAAGIPMCRAEFDRYLAEGKVDNADTAKFAAVLEKIRERNDDKKDFAEFIPEFEKYSATDHLLGKANFGLPLFDRLSPYLYTLQRVSEYYDQKMGEAETADELLAVFRRGNRLNKFFFENDLALVGLRNAMKARLDAFTRNAKRFSFTEAQKTTVLAELQRLETEQHILFSRAARYFPMMLFDVVDAVARGGSAETHGSDFFRMHPITGAPFRVFALKTELHGRGYAELIARKYDVRKDFYQLPKKKFLPGESVYGKNPAAAMAISDSHETRFLGMKYEVIAKLRTLAAAFSARPQTDPFTGKTLEKRDFPKRRETTPLPGK